jgi:DUF4097 and DUF4098 domain-containing protein YvlB
MKTASIDRFAVLLVGLALMAAPATAQDHRQEEHAQGGRQQSERRRDRGASEATERFSRKIPLGTSGQFELSNQAGDIQITGGGGSEVLVEAVKRGHAESESESQRQLAAVEIEVVEGAGRAEVRTVYRRGYGRARVSVDYTVTVPVATQLTVKSVSGDATVKGIKGNVHIESVSGDVNVDAASRTATVKSVSGNVLIVSAGTGGELTASSVSGSLQARNVKTDVLDLETVSGNLVLTDVTTARATIHSMSGNLTYDGSLVKGGRYELKSHSGNIKLAIPGNVGFELTASSYSGSVRSDLPVTIRGDIGTSDWAPRGPRGRTMRGQFGDGSAYLELTTFSGNIAIGR